MRGRMSDSAALELLPAVDVANGRAVRPAFGGVSGDCGDPIAVALAWQSAGARWIHLVDLDLAYGRGSNHALLRQVVGAVDIDVQVSGGIHNDATLRAAMATGCARVILSTTALEQPAWWRQTIAAFGDRVAVGLDIRGDVLAARGGVRDGANVWEMLDQLDEVGCQRYVVTDVTKDGTMQGPNLALLRDVCARTDRPVVASGGVSSLDDLRALASLVGDGVEGAIVGKALYEAAFTLEAAIAAVRECAGR